MKKTVNVHLQTLGVTIYGVPMREFRRVVTRYQRYVLRRKPLIHKGGKPR